MAENNNRRGCVRVVVGARLRARVHECLSLCRRASRGFLLGPSSALLLRWLSPVAEHNQAQRSVSRRVVLVVGGGRRYCNTPRWALASIPTVVFSPALPVSAALPVRL